MASNALTREKADANLTKTTTAMDGQATADKKCEPVSCKPAHKNYVPVSQTDDQPHSNQNTVSSFADFIQMKKNKKLVNGQSSSIQASAGRHTRRRLVHKNGICNVKHKHIRKVKRHYLADIFTTLIDIKWRWALFIYTASFIITWLLFAAVWLLIAYAHRDLENIPGHNPCVLGIDGFRTAFLFSLETQHTIGYGTRVTTDECTEAIALQMIQSIVGVLAQCLVTGMIYAKVSKPKRRAETLMFSKDAVISCRDGQLCLMFRIGDMRSSHLVEAHVRALLIRRRITKEGEVLPLDHQELDLGYADGTDRLLIIWPIIVIHKIDEGSPFWKMSQTDLSKENFELLVILEGTIESTGMTTQARTSYLPSEILWGRKLERLVTYQKESGGYQVDYNRFDSTVPADTPSCSAKDLAARAEGRNDNEDNNDDYGTYKAEGVGHIVEADYKRNLLPEDGVVVDMNLG